MTTWSREDVVSRIVAGEHLIVYNSTLLRITDSWLDKHPGGSLALLHFVGRDATDEINAYHSDQARALLKGFTVGSVQLENGIWHPILPPVMAGWVRKDGQWHSEASPTTFPDSLSSEIYLIQKDSEVLKPTADALKLSPSALKLPPSALSPAVQTQHSAAFHELHQRIIDAGLYSTPYLTGYGPEVLRYLLLSGLSAYSYFYGWLITSAVFLGLLWHQLAFTVHDLGHMGVTHNWTIDRLLAIFIADFIGGLSIGWWVENHNVHHLVTNHPSHDPDIEHLPFFAISPVFFNNLWSSYYKKIMSFDRFAKLIISLQHKLFYIVMMFARFNLYANSYAFLYKKAWNTKRVRGGRWAWWLEIAGLVCFWTWYGSVLYGCGTWRKALTYLLVTHIVTSPLHVQLVLSHFSMSTEDLGPIESFPHRQLRTTTDVKCHPSVNFIHGGLQFQVTHHLFPRLPRHNLSKASKLVKDFAMERGLVYAEFGFIEGNHDVVNVLKGVADQVRLVGKVAKAEAQEAVDKKIQLSEESAKY